MRLEAFLPGVEITLFLIAAVFFLRFWRDTRDVLFLSFAAFFAVEGFSRIWLLSLARPGEGRPWIYCLGAFASLLLIAAILRKNYGKGG
jgi:uncharacterized membrane protein HdeD (DUF308 family)